MKLRSEKSLRWCVCIALALLACAAYWRVRHADFVQWDDGEFVAENERIQRMTVETLCDIFRVTPKLGPQASAQYVPLTLLSFAVEHRLFGLNPFYYHLNNVLVNACNVVLVFWLIIVLLRGHSALTKGQVDEHGAVSARSISFVAFVTALFFAVHPLHVESVAWVSERKDVLCTFFYLLSMLLYEKASRRRSWLWSLMVLVSGCCALLSKPMAVTLPVALLLQDHLMGRALNMRRMVNKVPLLFAAGALACINGYTQKSAGALSIYRVADWHYNAIVAAKGVVFYLQKCFFPLNLSAVYPAPKLVGYLDPDTLMAVLVVLLLVALAAMTWRTRRLLSFCILFFGVTLAPMSQLLPTGMAVAAADRFFYLPSLGLFLLLAWLLDLVRQARHGQSLACLLVAGLGLMWLALTIERTGIWRNSFTLWADTARKAPHSDTVLNNLGIMLAHQGKPAEARIMYERSLALATNSYALINLGLLNLREGNTNAARELLNLCEALDPTKFETRYARAALEFNLTNYVEASSYLASLADERPLAMHIRLRLGAVYMLMAQTNKAIAALRQALDQPKQGAGLYLEIGQLYEQSGDTALADEMYQQGLAKFPRQPPLLYRHGVALSKLGKHQEAISQFMQHLAVQSNNWDAWSNLALCYRQIGATSNAIEASRRAVASQSASAEALYNHACIEAYAGNVDQAIAALRLALTKRASLRAQALRDPDFAALRSNADFRAIVGAAQESSQPGSVQD
jgi:Tfp pilus assembly protein PilF